MLKRDFGAIAAVIAAQRARYGAPCTDVESIDRIAEGIATHAAAVNKSFDRAHFLDACGLPPRKGT